jgi:hypothetical protein
MNRSIVDAIENLNMVQPLRNICAIRSEGPT